MRCDAGTVPSKELAAAQAAGFCYSTPPAGPVAGAAPAMKM